MRTEAIRKFFTDIRTIGGLVGSLVLLIGTAFTIDARYARATDLETKAATEEAARMALDRKYDLRVREIEIQTTSSLTAFRIKQVEEDLEQYHETEQLRPLNPFEAVRMGRLERELDRLIAQEQLLMAADTEASTALDQ